MADTITQLSDALKQVQTTLALLDLSSNVTRLNIALDSNDPIAALDAIDAENKLLLALDNSIQTLQDSITAVQATATTTIIPPTPENEQGVPPDLLGVCEKDGFQGLRFYDGVSFGYLRLFADKVELLVGENYSFDIDGTLPHTFRLVGKGKDIKLYIDGTLAIDATGKFTLASSEKLIEFGDIAGRSQSVGSAWQSFKYSVDGDFSGDQTDEFVLGEIMSLPGGGIGSIKSYNENLYVSYDPDDTGLSSCIYRYQEGFAPEQRATLAITRSNITSVIIDPNRDGNVFGTSGKFIGTERGLQYILGGKPNPFDVATKMNDFPNQNGWTLSESTTGSDQNLYNGVLTIDTRDEPSPSFLKYVMGGETDWGQSVQNTRGWTVEARVRISDDGKGSPIDLPTFYTPRDYVIVIDSSDTMTTGNNMTYAKQLAKTFLASMHPGDNATVLSFDNSNHIWSAVLQQASGDKINEMSIFIDQIVPVPSNALLLEALQYALGLNFTHDDKPAGTTPASKGKVVILIGSGNVTNGSYTTIPATILAQNISGPNVAIHTIGVGSNVFGTASDKKKVYRDLATQNSGYSTFLTDFDNVSLKAKNIWDNIAPETFDWISSVTPPGKPLDPRTSFVLQNNVDCQAGSPTPIPPRDVLPDEDGINAPGILINDGTYQEVVQFFEKGVRLKYAQVFARAQLSNDFYTIRIIGRGTAIAVYAKSDTEGEWKKLIYAPEGLFVKATSIGEQESLSITKDSFGTPHAVWQDSRNDNWSIFYSRIVAKQMLSAGRAHTSTSDSINTIIADRVAFGIPATTITNLPTNGIIAPNASFISTGIKVGDYISFRSFVDANGDSVSANGRYVINQIIDEAVLVLDTTEILSTTWSSADFIIYRGEDTWTVPSLVSNQPLDSMAPDILAHSNGDLYVAYENISQGSRDIYIRRGTSGPFSTYWKETVQVTHGSGICTNPKLAELSSGDILVVWEDTRTDNTRSQIFYAIISVHHFGFTECQTLVSATPNSSNAKNPNVVICDGLPIIVYEDTDGTNEQIYCITFSLDNAPDLDGIPNSPLVPSSPFSISNVSGNNTKPSLSICNSVVNICWENDLTGVKEIFFASGSCSSGIFIFDNSTQLQITNSRGMSENPNIACDSLGNIWIAFQDDRLRSSYPEIYFSKYDVTLDKWISTGQDGLDARLDAYVTSSFKPKMIVDDFSRVLTMFETVSGAGKKILSSANYDGSTNFNTSVIGYFTLDDETTDTVVKNRIKNSTSSANGVASQNTADISILAPDTGVSLFNTSLQRSFDLKANGNAFKIDSSLIQKTGAIDFWFRPHWDSTDTTTRVLFGNDNVGTVTPNKMVMSIEAIVGGNALRFRIIDDSGNVRQTEVQNTTTNNFVWSAEDEVHIRASWDQSAVGLSSMNSVSFSSTTVGLAVGGNGVIFRTIDGGVTWTLINTGLTYDLYSVDFLIDGLTAIVSGEYGTILKSLDGGLTWTVIDTEVTNDLYSVVINSVSGTYYAVGSSGLILRSTDSGSTWVAITSGTTYNLNAIAILIQGLTTAVVAVGNSGTILQSVDDGLTFTAITVSDITGNINGITRTHQAGSYNTYICGDKGLTYKTIDAGTTWTDVSFTWSVGYQPNLTSISQSGTSKLYVGGQNGLMAKSFDDGVTWIENKTGVTQGTFTAIDAWMGGAGSGSDVIVLGPAGSVIVSDDSMHVQKYYITRCGNLNININGKTPTQVRTGDSPFIRTPGSDLYFGDYQFSGTSTANAVFDELVIYNAIPSNSYFRRGTYFSKIVGIPNTLVSPQTLKRIEWGSISPLSKNRSHWSDVDISFCGSKEPVIVFQWSAQLGLVDDVVRDMAMDSGGFLWLATENGVSKFDTNEVNVDIENWISGYSELPNSDGRFVNYTNIADDLVSDSINTICTDGDDDIWMGTSKGLMFLQRNQSSFDDPTVDPVDVAFKQANPQTTTGNEKQSGNVSSNAVAGGTNPNRDPINFRTLTKATDGLVSDNITVVRAFENIIIVGTTSGISVITKASQKSDADSSAQTGGSQTTTLTGEVAASDQTSNGTSATTSTTAGSSTGVDQGSQQQTTSINQTLQNTSNPASNTNVKSTPQITFMVQNYTVMDGLPSNSIQSITYDPVAKEILLGTDNGMARLNRGGDINRTGTSEGLISNNIFSVTIDKAGKKYIGSDMGLTVIDGLDYISYPPSSGIGYGAIGSGSTDSAGSVWFATSTGLVQFDQNCDIPKFTKYDISDGIVSDPSIIDFKYYRILGGSIPTNGCEKALVAVSVNGERLISGFDVNASAPWIIFDNPLSPSDDVEVVVHRGWRKVKCFDSSSDNKLALANLKTDRLSLQLYKKRFPAGLVDLGANSASGASIGSSMYFVMAQPLTSATTAISAVNSPAGANIITATKGNSIYSDETENITLLPTNLDSIQGIQLPSADFGVLTDEYLEFVLSTDAVVYVAYDTTAESIPGWLRSFEPVPSVYRTIDMEVFKDGSGEEKLFVGLAGTNGCVYEVLASPDACDISDSIAVDAIAPEGCANITRINSPTSITLSITATDAVTGVSEMQISARSDFTDDGTVDSPWIPYQSSYIFEVPPASITDVSTVVDLTTVIPGATLSKFFKWNDLLLVSTNTPGRVYSLDKNTGTMTMLFDTGEAQILSMNSFGQYLLVGTGTNGRAFIWDGTSLTQLSLPGGEKISAIGAFDNRAFFGTSPEGKIYEMDQNLVIQLFEDTLETEINGFALFGGRLYWATGNDQIAEGDVLSTTTTNSHHHTITTATGWVKLADVNGTTSTADGHEHQIIAGVVQPTNGHSHILNGINSGKVFRYDTATNNSSIVHSDRDYRISSIVSTSLDAQGLLFVGTMPNGKILRFIPTEGIFIKSFDTQGNDISAMSIINTNVNAVSDDDIFQFDGRRWVFQVSATTDVSDIVELDGDIIILAGTKILKTQIKSTTSIVPTVDQCAFIRFKDAGGNITKITDDDGAIIKCYNPCTSVSGSSSTTSTTDTSGSTDTTNNTTNIPPTVHRLTEIDQNSKVVSLFSGPEAFLSGNKVESEIGVYESEVFNGTNSLVQWVSISWVGSTLPGSSITLSVRSGTTLTAIKTAEWSNEFTSPTDNSLTNQNGQYLQFRATLTVDTPGVPSPELYKVDIQLRTSMATHFFTTNFVLPDNLLRGILTHNSCINPPSTDIVFAVSGLDSVDFADYYPIIPNKVFEVPTEHQRKNLRIGIKLISSPTSVPVIDEFALLFSLANDAIIRLNLPNTPSSTGQLITSGNTRTISTDVVEGHSHLLTIDSNILEVAGVNGTTTINGAHSHNVIAGVVQPSSGHMHTLLF